jgi:hypothetical protein
VTATAPLPPLLYLDFEYSEDHQGIGTFEAMASTQATQAVRVHQEITRVLHWAHTVFAEMRAPLDEGGEWDFDLQGQQEWSVAQTWVYNETTNQLTPHLNAAGPPRHSITLSLTGTPQFCEAFRQQFSEV